MDVDIDIYELDSVFVASGYALPLNYQRKKIQIDSIQRQFESIESRIKILELIQREQKDTNLAIKRIEAQENKQVEILGIFAAVVLFAAGGINIFK